ncbi:alditol oxidase [Streptomyces sodiiphilus]|uniref:Alditol oxidase n=1 Tax=Streptomyces sodiiphilus TaxID=226217 RepID=A0ABN2P2A5_9ACTN
MPTSAAAAPKNWAGNITFAPARVHRPAAVGELQEIVAGAERVRALGTGHSFNRVADTEGDLVRLDGLPHRFEPDPASATVTVAAGMRYAEVAGLLHAEGFALANLASLPHISVAGACATGTHGSGDTQQSLAGAVAALDIVGPGGEIRRLSREEDADRLLGAAVSLGALGVVVGVTLDIEPAYEVAQWVYTGLPLDALADGFGELFSAAYSVSVFTDWREEGMVWLKRRTDREGPGHPGDRWLGARRAVRPHHPVPGMPPEYCTRQGGVPGPWHERLPHFRPDFTPSRGEELQSELLLPRDAAAEASRALRGLGDRIAPVLQVSEVRTVAADGPWLSPAHGRDSVAFHFTWLPDAVAVLPVIAEVEAALTPLGARPHWGKLTAADPRTLPHRYGRAEDFRRLMRECDPAGVFRNAFLDGLWPTG